MHLFVLKTTCTSCSHFSPTSNQQYPSFHDLGPKLCTCSHNASMTCSESPTQTCSIQDDHLSPTITENSTESSPCQSVSFMKTLDDEGSDISNETCSSSSSRVCPCSPCPIDIRELYSDTDRVVETLVQAREDHVIHLLPKVSMKEIQKMATDHKVTTIPLFVAVAVVVVVAAAFVSNGVAAIAVLSSL